MSSLPEPNDLKGRNFLQNVRDVVAIVGGITAVAVALLWVLGRQYTQGYYTAVGIPTEVMHSSNMRTSTCCYTTTSATFYFTSSRQIANQSKCTLSRRPTYGASALYRLISKDQLAYQTPICSQLQRLSLD